MGPLAATQRVPVLAQERGRHKRLKKPQGKERDGNIVQLPKEREDIWQDIPWPKDVDQGKPRQQELEEVGYAGVPQEAPPQAEAPTQQAHVLEQARNSPYPICRQGCTPFPRL